MRSSLLAHWTGKDIGCDVHNLTDDDRRAYVTRLRDILEGGFWMTTPTERFQVGPPSGGTLSFDFNTPMTCFTEVRLSQSHIHSSRYGLIAVVVDRSFVLDRWGGPVHYIRNHPNEFVGANFRLLRDWLSGLINDTSINEKIPNVWEARCNLDLLFTLLKGMSDPGTDNFAYLDEHEWRIPFSHGQFQKGRIAATGQSRPEYKITILPRDVRLLVLPDAGTRAIAMRDPAIGTWLSGIEQAPPLLTVAECGEM